MIVATDELFAWARAFAVTQAVEVPIYTWALRAGPLPGRWLKPLAAAFGTSLVTHPFIFLVLPRVWPGSYGGYVLAAEAVAVGVEAVWLARFGLRAPLLVSLLANAASVGVGWLVLA